MITTEQITTRHPVVEAGESIGVKVIIRPWWGSRRAHNERVHSGCGGAVWEFWDWETRTVRPWCSECRKYIQLNDIQTLRVRHTWLCSRIRYPRVENGTVVFWEGPCGSKRHDVAQGHSQTLKVVDVADGTCLIKVRAGIAGRNFLIGTDDGHPFATAVPRKITNVQDAFDWLVPKLVREAFIECKEVKRQGDWFFVPDKGEPKLSPHNYGGPLVVAGSSPQLYTNRLYHNVHLIYNGVQTRHTGELVAYKALRNTTYGGPRIKGEVKAPDHPTVVLDTWHIGVRRRSGSGTQDDALPGDD